MTIDQESKEPLKGAVQTPPVSTIQFTLFLSTAIQIDEEKKITANQRLPGNSTSALFICVAHPPFHLTQSLFFPSACRYQKHYFTCDSFAGWFLSKEKSFRQ